MSEWIFKQVAGPFGFTEGPLWIGDGLLFTDMTGDRVLHYNPQTGQCTDWRNGNQQRQWADGR